MKKVTTLLAAVLLMAGYSQSRASWISDIGGALKVDSLTEISNYSPYVYATYAPKLAKKSDRFGGGALIVYNLNDNVGFAIGGDYLGRFSMLSGDLTLKVGFQPFKNWTKAPSVIQTLKLTPFALAGLGKPFGGTGGEDVAIISDVGLGLSFGHLWGGQFDAGFCWGRWDNAGPYTGERWHIFGGWSLHF